VSAEPLTRAEREAMARGVQPESVRRYEATVRAVEGERDRARAWAKRRTEALNILLAHHLFSREVMEQVARLTDLPLREDELPGEDAP